jgi:hypothetical protein
MGPEWIASFHGAAPLPSRYFTPAFLFWICLAAVTLWTSADRIAAPVCLLGIAAVAFCALTRESAYLNDWLTFCQKLDAAGSGFLAGADDPEYMSRSYPDQKLLDHWIPYARQHGLSVFAAPRAKWLGQNVTRLVSKQTNVTCRLTLDTPEQAGSALRFSGLLDGPFKSLARQEDLLFTDSAGTAIGVGRTFVDTRGGEVRHGFVGYAARKAGQLTKIYLIPRQGFVQYCGAYP